MSTPTLEQRLDAAAEEWRSRHYQVQQGDPAWEKLDSGIKGMYREHVEPYCRAFAPEHFEDTGLNPLQREKVTT